MRSGDCGVITWGRWLDAGNAEQEYHPTKHDGETATQQRDSDRILAKLDGILRELRRRK